MEELQVADFNNLLEQFDEKLNNVIAINQQKLNEKLNNVIAINQQKLDEKLTNELSALKKELAIIHQKQDEKLMNEVSALKNEKLRNEITIIHQKHEKHDEKLKKEIAIIKKENTILKNEVSALKKEITIIHQKHDEKVSALKKELGTLNKKINKTNRFVKKLIPFYCEKEVASTANLLQKLKDCVGTEYFTGNLINESEAPITVEEFKDFCFFADGLYKERNDLCHRPELQEAIIKDERMLDIIKKLQARYSPSFNPPEFNTILDNFIKETQFKFENDDLEL